MKHRRAPTFCVWEITLACNAACVHCGSRAGKARTGELDGAEALALCDAIAGLGVRRVTLSGGEPLVRDDWQDIAGRLIAGGVEVDLISNGIALDGRAARAAASMGLRGVTLSIDGTESVHDELRGREGGFRLAMQAAALLRGEGVPVGAVTQVNTRNAGLLPDIRGALEDAGFMGWQLQLTMPIGRCEGGGGLVVDPSAVPSIIDLIAAFSRRGRMQVYAADNIGWMLRSEPLIRDYAEPSRRFYQGCHAGLALIGITSDGNVRGCLSLPPAFDEASVRRRDLADIWKDESLFSYNRRFDENRLTGPCRSCAFRRVCRAGCTCLAWSSTGTVTENPYCARLHRPDGEGGS